MSPNLRMFSVLAVLLLTVGACGGADPASDGEAVVDAAESTAASAEDQISSLSENCTESFQAFNDIQTQFTSALSGSGGDFSTAADELDQLADTAPEEIADAFQSYADELRPVFEGLADLDLSAGEVPSADQIGELSSLTQDVDQSVIQDASAEIQTYFEEDCAS